MPPLNPMVVGSLIGAGSNFLGNLFGFGSQQSANSTNLKIARETNAFNAEQAQLNRDWQEKMWNAQNEYNSPQAMISRGLNPFIGNSGAGVSKSLPSGAQASAAGLPSMQAFRPDFSSVGSAIASFAQARKAITESNQMEAMFPYLRDQMIGNTNWRNIGIGQSGYWNATTGRRSAVLDQSKEAQELDNMRSASNLNAAQMTQVYLQANAQRILNKYLDNQQQADLFIKAASLDNLRVQKVLTEKQIWTELAKAVLVAAEAKGQHISNEIASQTARDLIEATNMSNTALYNERLWDSKNVNVTKNMDYSLKKNLRDFHKWNADKSRKDASSWSIRNAIDYTDKIFRGVGNSVGY